MNSDDNELEATGPCCKVIRTVIGLIRRGKGEMSGWWVLGTVARTSQFVVVTFAGNRTWGERNNTRGYLWYLA